MAPFVPLFSTVFDLSPLKVATLNQVKHSLFICIKLYFPWALSVPRTKLGHPIPVVSLSLSYFSHWSQLGSHPKTEAGSEGVCADCCLSWGSGPWKGGRAFSGSCSIWARTPWGGHVPLGKARSGLSVILWLGHPSGLAWQRGSPGLDKSCPVCFTSH